MIRDVTILIKWIFDLWMVGKVGGNDRSGERNGLLKYSKCGHLRQAF